MSEQEEKQITTFIPREQSKCRPAVSQKNQNLNLKIKFSLKPNDECDFDPMKLGLSHNFRFIDNHFKWA